MAENLFFSGIKPSKFSINGKRAEYYDVSDVIVSSKYKPDDDKPAFLERTDHVYRTQLKAIKDYALKSRENKTTEVA